MEYTSYACESYNEWREIISNELQKAEKFEIHCWKDEEKFYKTAPKFGKRKETSWNGFIVTGDVTEEFSDMVINSG